MTVRVHLIRHAETTANAAQVIAGWTDVPLTQRGEEQARALAPVLSTRIYDGVWASDLSRAAHTARLAGFEPTLDRRVRELDFGELDGRAWAEIAEEYGQRFSEFGTFQAPGGESFVDLRVRVIDFLDHLSRGEHLVFCHGGVIRLVLAEMGQHRFVANCTVLIVDWTNRSVVSELRPDGTPLR